MSQPFWDDELGAFEQFIQDGDASLWDTCFLGGVRVPGLVSAEAEVSRKWDVKTAPGTDGATITDQGYDPPQPTLKILIWTPEHWSALQTLLATICPKPGKGQKSSPPPVSIVHPALNLLGIDSVLVLSVSSPRPSGPKGAMEVSLKLVQWLKPKKAPIVTPSSKSKGKSNGSANFTIGTQGPTQGSATTPQNNPSPPSKNPSP